MTTIQVVDIKNVIHWYLLDSVNLKITDTESPKLINAGCLSKVEIGTVNNTVDTYYLPRKYETIPLVSTPDGYQIKFVRAMLPENLE